MSILSFFKPSYLVEPLPREQREPKVSSHIYLGRIKHIKEVHQREIEKKDKIISDLEYKLDILETH